MIYEAAKTEADIIHISDGLNLPLLPNHLFRKKFKVAVAACKIAVAAIDTVHKIRKLDPIPIRISNNRQESGVYHKEGGTGRPIEIEISKRGDNIALTVVHEVGHFLEGAAIPGAVFGVRQWSLDDNTKGWQQAILQSGPARRLSEIHEEGNISITNDSGKPESRQAEMKYVTYLLGMEEFWGRSYSQYIAVRSGNETLLEQVKARCSPPAPYPLQWSDVEFEPIAREFDILFGKIGWRP